METLRTQLNTGSGTEGEDCGVLTIINIILWASNGKVGPQSQGEVARWVKDIRRWAGRPRGPMMTFGDCYQVYNSPALKGRFLAKNLRAPKTQYFYHMQWKDMVTSLGQGKAVHMCLDYGVLRKGNAPMGSATFNGGHSVALIGRRKKEHGWSYTNDGDPLFDGRRAGIPKGWQSTRVWNFKRAAGAFGWFQPGYGYCTCIVVSKG